MKGRKGEENFIVEDCMVCGFNTCICGDEDYRAKGIPGCPPIPPEFPKNERGGVPKNFYEQLEILGMR